MNYFMFSLNLINAQCALQLESSRFSFFFFFYWTSNVHNQRSIEGCFMFFPWNFMTAPFFDRLYFIIISRRNFNVHHFRAGFVDFPTNCITHRNYASKIKLKHCERWRFKCFHFDVDLLVFLKEKLYFKETTDHQSRPIFPVHHKLCRINT